MAPHFSGWLEPILQQMNSLASCSWKEEDVEFPGTGQTSEPKVDFGFIS